MFKIPEVFNLFMAVILLAKSLSFHLNLFCSICFFLNSSFDNFPVISLYFSLYVLLNSLKTKALTFSGYLGSNPGFSFLIFFSAFSFSIKAISLTLSIVL